MASSITSHRLGVRLEALVEAPSRRKDEGADEPTRPETRLEKELGHRRQLVGHDIVAVVPDAVEDRVGAGKNGGVRRQRQRCRCDAGIEDDASSGEPVDKAGSDLTVAVWAEPVRTGRVKGDHEDIEAAVARAQRLVSGARNGRDEHQARDSKHVDGPRHRPR
jgi:hypothetical protein